MTRLRVTCEAYTSATPYVAWRDLLRPLVGAAWEDPDIVVGERLRTVVRELDAELEPWLPLLAIPLGADLPATPQVAELAPAWTPRTTCGSRVTMTDESTPPRAQGGSACPDSPGPALDRSGSGDVP